MAEERDPYRSGSAYPRWFGGMTHLDRYLASTGATRAALTDPLARLQVDMLRHTISVLESALDDEHVPPEVRRRIVERVVYGCAPNPVDADERVRANARLVDTLVQGSPIVAVSPQPDGTMSAAMIKDADCG